MIGGRGSILGPLLGTIVLTVLPEIAAPLAAWSTFLYAALLLVIVVALPGGIAALLDARNRRKLPDRRAILPETEALGALLGHPIRGIVVARRRAELWRCSCHRRP